MDALLDLAVWALLLSLVISAYILLATLIMTVGVILFYIVRSFIWKGAFK